jgi:glyoxylase-like metal-dependent hydrolase (beta-lactamase superfamily II)
VTHAHGDHAGCVAELARHTGAQVLAHRDAVPYLERTASLPYTTFLQRLVFWLSERVMSKFEPCKVDRLLQDGDIVQALGGLRVIHVPGHTPGSIALYQPERQILFCGDVFFHNSPKKGLWVSPAIISVDAAQAQKSARKLAALRVETLCVSHGALILTGAQEKMQAWAIEARSAD